MTQEQLQEEYRNEQSTQKYFDSLNHSHKIYDGEVEMGVSGYSAKDRLVASPSFFNKAVR